MNFATILKSKACWAAFAAIVAAVGEIVTGGNTAVAVPQILASIGVIFASHETGAKPS